MGQYVPLARKVIEPPAWTGLGDVEQRVRPVRQREHSARQEGGGDVGPMAYRAFLGEHGDSPRSISLCPDPGSVRGLGSGYLVDRSRGLGARTPVLSLPLALTLSPGRRG